MLRRVLMILAGVYSLLGISALIIGFVIPWDDPLAAVYAILLGAPWVQLLGRLNVFADGPVAASIALVTGSIALNAGILWWWALTRRGASSKSDIN